MSLNEILLVVIGGGLVVGTLYIMIRAIFLPNPSSVDQSKKKQAAEEKPFAKKAAKT